MDLPRQGGHLLVKTARIAVSDLDFAISFEDLTGNRPYPWQQKLIDLFVLGQIPDDINLPTGAGKTSIMSIWLLALTQQAITHPQAITIPRRLVWVVNRRVVVDQATNEAEEIRKRLADSRIASLEPVRQALRSLSTDADENLIAISTLRGEKEDNREWSEDPSRPAIIVGTVDMIGSRLLFSGYGDSRYWRAQHAGLLGQDTLIVNDEAHLTPAFATLLSKVEKRQRDNLKPLHTLRLSATHSSSQCWPNSLEEDRKSLSFRKVFEAPKRLQIREAGKQYSTLLELATQARSARTLIFVKKPEDVAAIADRLRKMIGEQATERILTLTGTMRGMERDQIVESPVFKAFTNRNSSQEPFWLIATSAGEVGVNISADRLITDLDTLDHLLQRFGRLNRFGETLGIAYVLVSDADKKDERKTAALAFLQDLDKTDESGEPIHDISPAVLFGRELPVNACTEAPLQAELHDWLIDVWSQTTLGLHPARPEVEPWLHGKLEDIPETYIAWREDVSDLVQDGIADEDREEALQKYRVLAHEQLREPTTKLLEKLEKLAQLQNPGLSFLCRTRDGSVSVWSLGRFANIDNERERRRLIAELAFCQLILPPGCGALADGMFTPNKTTLEAEQDKQTDNYYDVSGCIWGKTDGKVITNPNRASYRATKNENEGWTLEKLGVAEEEVVSIPSNDLDLKRLSSFEPFRNFRLLLKVMPEREDAAKGTVLLYFGKLRNKRESVAVVPLSDHIAEVGDVTGKLARCAGLPENLVLALQKAGQLHDLGKQEKIWQKAAGNLKLDGSFKSEVPVAKPIAVMNGRALGGFRHELASLRYAEKELDKQAVSPEFRDLVLHLIAAHHGYARPYFEKEAYDRNCLADSARINLESVQRFARLQRQYGAWGLACLEAILRAADGMVSAHSAAEEQPNNG
jgi:CRISPR-associated endonuclease/helicase Cas3